MWGHDLGVYDGPKGVYNIPLSASMSVAEGDRVGDLTDLRKTFPLGDNGVTEWEVYGSEVGEQGASIARTLSRN